MLGEELLPFVSLVLYFTSHFVLAPGFSNAQNIFNIANISNTR